MKKQGISVAERHFEKVVVGLFAVLAVGAAVWEFALNGTQVRVNGRPQGIGDLDKALSDAAARLKRSMHDGGPVEIDVPIGNEVDAFKERLSGGVFPGSELVALRPRVAGILLKEDAGRSAVYAVPAFAAPTGMRTVQFMDAWADGSGPPSSGDANPAERSDVVWVTPIATVDFAAARAQLARAEPSALPALGAIPSHWYGGCPLFADVVFERQELQPNGEWGRVTEVPIGWWVGENESIRPGLEQGIQTNLRDELLVALGDSPLKSKILQPDAPPTQNPKAEISLNAADAAGASEPPAPVSGSDVSDSARDLVIIQKQIAAKQKLIAKRTAELKDLGGPISDEEYQKIKRDRAKKPDAGDPGSGAGGGGGFGMGGGAFSGRRTGGDAKKEEKERQRQEDDRWTKTRQRTKLEKDVAELVELAKSLGVAESIQVTVPTEDPTEVDPCSQDSGQAWTHDTDAVPEHTYRYRAVLRHWNPFFGREALLSPEQTSLAKSPFIQSSPSEWSAPIKVRSLTQFFLTSVDFGTSLARAKFEVYRSVNGKVQKTIDTYSIGDEVGGGSTRVPEGIDFGSGWLVAGIERDLTPQRVDGSGGPATGESASFLVVLQDATSGELIQIRSSATDARSPIRQEFDDDWRLQKNAPVADKGSNAAKDGSGSGSFGEGSGGAPSPGGN
ncbi:MAG: hypothetical protein O2819_02295 [Planctomycetota bacterium]|nr:hypothetical protein [Planctomycetota bacterium]MDA1106493.1 hypothetical protein [Planctomycetota bacterium]